MWDGSVFDENGKEKSTALLFWWDGYWHWVDEDMNQIMSINRNESLMSKLLLTVWREETFKALESRHLSYP